MYQAFDPSTFLSIHRRGRSRISNLAKLPTAQSSGLRRSSSIYRRLNDPFMNSVRCVTGLIFRLVPDKINTFESIGYIKTYEQSLGINGSLRIIIAIKK